MGEKNVRESVLRLYACSSAMRSVMSIFRALKKDDSRPSQDAL